MVCVWLCVFVFLCAPPSVSMYEVVRTEELTVLASVFEGASLGSGIRFEPGFFVRCLKLP